MGEIIDDLTKTIATEMAKTYDEAYKAGFYAGQAVAGMTLEECHANWKKFYDKVSDENNN